MTDQELLSRAQELERQVNVMQSRMTLFENSFRFYAACAAMQGLLSSCNEFGETQAPILAGLSVAAADALLAKLEETKK
jgi:hypothetical protein